MRRTQNFTESLSTEINDSYEINEAEKNAGKDNLMLTTVHDEPKEYLSNAHPEMIPNTYLAEDQLGKERLLEWHGETSKTVDIESQNQGMCQVINIIYLIHTKF